MPLRFSPAMRKNGMAYVMSLLTLVIGASVAAALCSTAQMNAMQADNQRAMLDARLTAESGMDFLAWQLRQCNVAGSGQALLDSAAARLRTRLDGTPNLGAHGIQYDGTTIAIPAIAMDADGRQFGAAITLAADDTLHLRVDAAKGRVARSLGMNFKAVPGHSAVFDYGIATRSAVQMTGNCQVRGLNSPSEARILSATYATQQAFSITGNASLQGDIEASNPSATVAMTGNVKVGGVSASDPNVYSHIHLGVGDMPFPEVDPTVFEPFATTVLSGSTSGSKTFTNIRIPANTNPTFAGNITLKGVIFIEKPNRVSFSGNTNLTGVIVTQDAGDNAYTTNTLQFTGNMTVKGVEQLPDTPEFHDLRQKPGAFLLAPGFGVAFTGNFGTVGGCMAADSFSFTGNAGGTIRGGIINYSDSAFSLTGNSQIVIDRSGTPGTPPGFSVPNTVAADAGSYVEYTN